MYVVHEHLWLSLNRFENNMLIQLGLKLWRVTDHQEHVPIIKFSTVYSWSIIYGVPMGPLAISSLAFLIKNKNARVWNLLEARECESARAREANVGIQIRYIVKGVSKIPVPQKKQAYFPFYYTITKLLNI